MQTLPNTDFQALKVLAERSGLNLLVVYRLMKGERVKDPSAWQRLIQAHLELQQQQSRQR